MPNAKRKSASLRRGVLSRPLDSLVFLIPLIVLYEAFSTAGPERVVAFQFLQSFIDRFGRVGVWAPGLAAIAILLATHAASREQWRIHWKDVGFMYVEAAALAVPLLIVNWGLPLAAGSIAEPSPMMQRLAMGIGAGIYEELFFRLIVITLIVMVGTDLLKFQIQTVAVVAIAASSLMFAAHHHPPFGGEPLHWTTFLFRTAAGAYLSVVFWFRGYGPAAGCHAAHNSVLVLLGAMG